MPDKPTSITVRIVSNRLPALPAAAHAAIVGAVSTSAHAIVAGAQQNAPVRTGTLRRSIHTTSVKDGLGAVIGPSVDYGIWVEYGSRGRSPRPYLRPAYEAEVPRFAANLQKILREL